MFTSCHAKIINYGALSSYDIVWDHLLLFLRYMAVAYKKCIDYILGCANDRSKAKLATTPFHEKSINSCRLFFMGITSDCSHYSFEAVTSALKHEPNECKEKKSRRFVCVENSGPTGRVALNGSIEAQWHCPWRRGFFLGVLWTLGRSPLRRMETTQSKQRNKYHKQNFNTNNQNNTTTWTSRNICLCKYDMLRLLTKIINSDSY